MVSNLSKSHICWTIFFWPLMLGSGDDHCINGNVLGTALISPATPKTLHGIEPGNATISFPISLMYPFHDTSWFTMVHLGFLKWGYLWVPPNHPLESDFKLWAIHLLGSFANPILWDSGADGGICYLEWGDAATVAFTRVPAPATELGL